MSTLKKKQAQHHKLQSSTLAVSSIDIFVVLPSRSQLSTLSLVPGARRFSFSLPKKVMAEISAAVFDLMVSNVHFPPQPFIKFFATLMSAVQLLHPHHVTSAPFLYC